MLAISRARPATPRRTGPRPRRGPAPAAAPAPAIPSAAAARRTQTFPSPRSGRRSPGVWPSRSAPSRRSTSPPKWTWSGPWDAREALERRGEGKVSFNDIIIKAVAMALRQHPGVQRLVAGGPHPLLERGPRQHGGGDRGRADHAGDPPCRPQVAAGDRRGNARTWPAARASGASSPRSTPGDVLRLQSGHARHRRVHRGDQSAGGRHPGGGPDRAEAGGARGSRWPSAGGCGSRCRATTG